MVQSFSDNKYVYSVDMMFAYINLFKKHLKVTKIRVKDMQDTLEYKGWGDPSKGIRYSANDVLENPKKYPDEMKRVKNANLRYPIIMYGNPGYIVDGVHRLTKATLEGREYINAYVFDAALMKNFILGKTSEKGIWKRIDATPTHELIEQFWRKVKIYSESKNVPHVST